MKGQLRWPAQINSTPDKPNFLLGFGTGLPAPPRLVFPLARANHAVGQRQPGHGFVRVGGVGAGQARQLEQAFDSFWLPRCNTLSYT